MKRLEKANEQSPKPTFSSNYYSAQPTLADWSPISIAASTPEMNVQETPMPSLTSLLSFQDAPYQPTTFNSTSVQFPVNLITIGFWKRSLLQDPSLIVEYSSATSCLSYTIQEGAHHFKIELPISTLYKISVQESTMQNSDMSFELLSAPRFLVSLSGQEFVPCADFTENYQATLCLTHCISMPTAITAEILNQFIAVMGSNAATIIIDNQPSTECPFIFPLMNEGCDLNELIQSLDMAVQLEKLSESNYLFGKL